MDRSKHKEGKDIFEAYQLAQRLQSMVGTHHPTALLPVVDFTTEELYVVTANEEEACSWHMGKLVRRKGLGGTDVWGLLNTYKCWSIKYWLRPFYDSVSLCLHQHLSAEELARQREAMKKDSKPCKISRFRGSAWCLHALAKSQKCWCV